MLVKPTSKKDQFCLHNNTSPVYQRYCTSKNNAFLQTSDRLFQLSVALLYTVTLSPLIMLITKSTERI